MATITASLPTSGPSRAIRSARPVRPVRPVRETSLATYRRRRLVAALLAVGLGLVVSSTADGLVGRGTGAGVGGDVVAQTYLVQPGDTLWSIGERFHGAASLADYVDVLVKVNGGAAVQVGQVITLP